MLIKSGPSRFAAGTGRRGLLTGGAALAAYAALSPPARAVGNIAFVQHTIVAGAVNGGTSPAVNTTGADFHFIGVSQFVGGGALTVSDNKSNSYTATGTAAGVENKTSGFWVANANSGSGHTFTVTGTGIAAVSPVMSFSGVLPVSPFDTGTGLNAGAAPGAITPAQAGEVFITMYGYNASGTTASINAGFTITDQNPYSVGVNEGGAMAYNINAGSGSLIPTWAISGVFSNRNCCIMVAFKANPVTAPPASGMFFGVG